MDYVYSSHLFNEISLKFTMYYLSVNFFFIFFSQDDVGGAEVMIVYVR